MLRNTVARIFPHLSFQKCSTLLCARRAHNFSSLISPDGYAPACLASLFFDSSEPQNIGKTSCFATSTLSHTCIYFLLSFSDSFFSLIFFSDLLSSSFLFSGSSRLCFSICPYCRKFDLCISFDYTFSI